MGLFPNRLALLYVRYIALQQGLALPYARWQKLLLMHFLSGYCVIKMPVSSCAIPFFALAKNPHLRLLHAWSAHIHTACAIQQVLFALSVMARRSIVPAQKDIGNSLHKT